MIIYTTLPINGINCLMT